MMDILEHYRPYADQIIFDWDQARTILKKELNDNTDADLTNLTYGILEQLRFAKMPWYLKDKDGWPIERLKGRPILNFIRIIIQNFRKVTG